ncbi:rod-binding protein [Rhizobium helianthi]|uniref:Rod-binding protein n=1 Tax=Rhizobium helianthi TaxID=1132695 RepID=A0ABW4M4A9_9HYPH
MAISPPSDLVMDVLRAADPTSVQEAQAKLSATRAATTATRLAAAGTGFSSVVDFLDDAGTRSHVDTARKADRSIEMPEEYRKFEASILQSFVNSMMPKDSEEVYGKGSAGEFWQSMMSEKIADEVAKSGGIGIAEQVFKHSLDKMRNEVAPNPTTDKDSRNKAISMIDEFERKVFDLASTERAQAEA